jgi:hypothetical protein
MGRWGGGYMDAVMNRYMIAWLLDEWGYVVMVVWMNEIMFAWAHGSRDGTSGKVHKLQIPNPKERDTAALLKTQYPMTPLPISPFPQHSRFEYAKWLGGNPLLSSIFRNSDIFIW